MQDPLYMGVAHKRIRDDRYDELLDNFMRAVVKRYRPNSDFFILIEVGLICPFSL